MATSENPSDDVDLPGLASLAHRETDVYAAHLETALSDPHLRAVLRLIDESLDFMIYFAGGPKHTDDIRTLSAIAGRIFNTSAAALREALNGYPQTSFLLQRDLVETHMLLDAFSCNLSLIARWSIVNNQERISEFGPTKLRKIIEKRDGVAKVLQRKEDYQRFCEHAAHLTMPALRMLQLPNGNTQLGPREDDRFCGECIHELGRRVLVAVLCNARVLVMLHERDGSDIPDDTAERLARLNAQERALYHPQMPAP